MNIKVTNYEKLDQIQHEGLREEAQAHKNVDRLIAGSAVILPKDGSGPMEGFWQSPSGPGMVVWGNDMSDWIDAESLKDLFKQYIGDMP